MTLHQQIATLRKSKGLTQEELAGRTGLTVRTIQRIESGESVPRSYTLKAIAQALDTPFESFTLKEAATGGVTEDPQAARDALQLLNLSSFFYIIIPYVHFLVPMNMLKKNKDLSPAMVVFARKLIRQQVYWVIATLLAMLLTLAYNLTQHTLFHTSYNIHYLWPFFIMYLVNAVIILVNARRIRRDSWQV
jgi:XRE family transcriptional regulator, regulator of sulfur utilization